MCRHVPDAQFAFQAPCCRRWFDCSECHFELVKDHRVALADSGEMAFVCKHCGSPFRKDLRALGEEDMRCPHCGNALVATAAAAAAAAAATSRSSSRKDQVGSL